MIWCLRSRKAMLRKALRRTDRMINTLVANRDSIAGEISALQWQFDNCVILNGKIRLQKKITRAEHNRTLMDSQIDNVLVVREALHTDLMVREALYTVKTVRQTL
uniref:Uncharacterized protein n=1 Tax=Plectus sambesii TaxID=2011161 RepID=A0A914XCD0_9BILA